MLQVPRVSVIKVPDAFLRDANPQSLQMLPDVPCGGQKNSWLRRSCLDGMAFSMPHGLRLIGWKSVINGAPIVELQTFSRL